MSASTVEPHDKMRARDVNRVARGEQAPRPPQRTPNVSRPPPPSSTNPKPEAEGSRANKEIGSDQMRRCYDSYYEYHRCMEEKGAEAQECKKVAEYYKSSCPKWIEKWAIQ